MQRIILSDKHTDRAIVNADSMIETMRPAPTGTVAPPSSLCRLLVRATVLLVEHKDPDGPGNKIHVVLPEHLSEIALEREQFRLFWATP